MVNLNLDVNIQQTFLTEELKRRIKDGFTTYSIQHMGYDGRDVNQTAFVAYDGYKFVGLVSILPFWSTLWIKYIFIEEAYRGCGIGTKLIKKALTYGKTQKHSFAFVETMSFQSPEFYRKLGFRLEFTRKGFADGACLHYFKKVL